MKCKSCGRTDVPDGSAFCNWCGAKLIKTARKKNTELKIPEPRKLPSGNWFVQLRIKGTSVSITEPTERACREKARAIKAGLIKPEDKTDITLGQAIDKYIEANSEVLSPSTLRGYSIIRENRFKDYMDKPMKNISDWQTVINKDAAKYSGKTMKNSWGLVRTVMVYIGYPVPDVNLPQVMKAERPYFTPEQVITFVEALDGHPIKIAALLGLHSLRRSEIAALTWDNIDLKKKTITVSGAAVPDKDNKMVVRNQTKTAASQRTIPIMIPELTDALAAVKDKTGPVVKCTPNNIYVRINNVCRKAGLPEVGVHGLRHSFASLGFHLGIPMEIICLWGGWSDSKTVRDIYMHLYKKDLEKHQTAMLRFYTKDEILNAVDAAA